MTEKIDSQLPLPPLPDEPVARLDAIAGLLDNKDADPQIRLQLAMEGQSLAEELGRADLVARCLMVKGVAYNDLFDFPAAYEPLQEAVRAYELLGDTRKLVGPRLLLGRVCMQLGQFDEARSFMEGGLELSRELGERTVESVSLGMLGAVYAIQGDYESAVECHLKALAIEEESGNEAGIAMAGVLAGMMLCELGDYDTAATYAQRSLELFLDTGDKEGQSMCFARMGDISMKRRDYAEAITHYRNALDMNPGNEHGEASFSGALGKAYLVAGDLTNASDMLHRCQELQEHIADMASASAVLLDLSKLYLRQGRHSEAYDSLVRVQEMAENFGMRPMLAEIHQTFSEYHELQGESAEALEHYKEYHRIEAEVASTDATTKLERMRVKLDLEKLEKESAIMRVKSERMELELDLARRVQLSLLPANPPVIPGLDIASVCVPALEVGGDYYDFFPFSDRSCVMAIGDITGKGMGAAIHMTLVKGMLRAFAESSISPKELLVSVNRHVHDTFSRGWFASMIYLVIDLEAMKLHFASAGHNPPLLLRGGELVSPERTGGMALGLTGDEKFRSTLDEYTISLHPGDTLIVYTDGFSEAMNASGDEYGDGALKASARRHNALPDASAIIEAISSDVHAFTAGAPQHDDMTMVAVKVKYEG